MKCPDCGVPLTFAAMVPGFANFKAYECNNQKCPVVDVWIRGSEEPDSELGEIILPLT